MYNAQQQSGIDAIKTACDRLKMPIAWKAYVLATAWHETGHTMQANRESINYSVAGLLAQFDTHRISVADAQRLGRHPGEPPLSIERQTAIANLIYGGVWGAANLGNTQPNDGWHFRGGGLDQCTGRRNYGLVASASGLGDALMCNPDLILQPPLAATAIATGMLIGRYTGVRLRDRLPLSGPGTLDQFTRARAIINGTDRAADIAAYAVMFQGQL